MIDQPSELGNEENVDVLLRLASPPTPLSDDVDDATLRLMVRSATRPPKADTRRSVPRLAVLGAVAAIVLGGAGTAAAATYTNWFSAFEKPDTVSRFTLPSGLSCEFRTIVQPGTGTAAEEEAVAAFLKDTDVLALADVDAELARMKARDVVTQGPDGDVVTPATQLYSQDQLYYDAVWGAITNVIWDHLEDTGVVDPVAGSNLSFAAQSDCGDKIR
jgi:hypothetical protein